MYGVDVNLEDLIALDLFIMSITQAGMQVCLECALRIFITTVETCLMTK